MKLCLSNSEKLGWAWGPTRGYYSVKREQSEKAADKDLFSNHRTSFQSIITLECFIVVNRQHNIGMDLLRNRKDERSLIRSC